MTPRKGLLSACLSAAILIFVFVLAGSPGRALAQGAGQAGTAVFTPQTISLDVGKSTIIKTPVKIKRVSIASPGVASVLVLTPHEVYVVGKSPGFTNLTLWGKDDPYTSYDVRVMPNIEGLKAALHELFPNEKDIKVYSVNGTITLSGTVSSATGLAAVQEVADKYASKKVVDLLQVGGVQQVMLEVRVAEIQRSLLRELGVNFSFLSASGNQYGVSLLGSLVQLPTEQPGYPAKSLLVSPAVNALLKLGTNPSWTGYIDALADHGLVKVLARPTLVAMSGKSADFLAGGEYPIPIPQGLGTVAIEYKKFGVSLSFSPTVLSDKRITMNITPQVSALDYTTALQEQGFIIPGLSERSASTTVELGDGQSFAIAGLLDDEVRSDIKKFPLLGDIPVLGALFRSTSFQKNQSELVIIVTPHLVKPINMANQTLPTDQYIQPNATEFYLFGDTEGKHPKAAPYRKQDPGKQSSPAQGLDGPFGHMMP